MYFLPGNTDVRYIDFSIVACTILNAYSLGMGRKHSKDVKDFFARSFGPLNQEISIHNHTFVALDAPGLVDEDYHRAAQGADYDDWEGSPDGPITFVRSVDGGMPSLRSCDVTFMACRRAASNIVITHPSITAFNRILWPFA